MTSTYEVGATQDLAVPVGWNGVRTQLDAPGAPLPYDNAGRLIVLKLDGGPGRTAARTPPPFLVGIGPCGSGRPRPRALSPQVRPLPWLGRRTNALSGPAPNVARDLRQLR